MNKNVLAYLMISIMIMMSLAGCSQSTVNEGGDVTIKYMTFSAAPDHIEDLENIIAEFEKQNPGIKVKYETVAYDNYFTKLQTVVSSDSSPDTFELNYENFINYSAKGALLDLDTLISKDKGFDPSIYNEMANNAFRYNDKQYGLVESFSNVVFLYNKELFDKSNLSYPNEDWTWKDELKAAQQITNEEEGIWGTYSPIQFWEFYKTIAQNGGSIFSDDMKSVTIDSKENVEALQWMVDKVNKYHVTPSDAQLSGQKNEDLFMAGKIGMLRTGIWMFNSFKDAPFDWDITLEPGNTNKAHHFFSNGVAVAQNSKNPEEAYKWIKFFTSSKEASKVRIDSSWELPAVSDKDVLNGYLSVDIPGNREAVFSALDTLVVPPVIEEWNELTDAVGIELQEAVMGTKTCQQALSDAKIKIEKLIK